MVDLRKKGESFVVAVIVHVVIFLLLFLSGHYGWALANDLWKVPEFLGQHMTLTITITVLIFFGWMATMLSDEFIEDWQRVLGMAMLMTFVTLVSIIIGSLMVIIYSGTLQVCWYIAKQTPFIVPSLMLEGWLLYKTAVYIYTEPDLSDDGILD